MPLLTPEAEDDHMPRTREPQVHLHGRTLHGRTLSTAYVQPHPFNPAKALQIENPRLSLQVKHIFGRFGLLR